jgi:hypothetical protein
MYKRPTLRLRDPCTTSFMRPVEGTFLHSITKNEKTKYFEPRETYIANYDNYIETLRKSYEESGAKFKVPKYILPMPEIDRVPPKNKSPIRFIDDVIVCINVLKCGKVRVKLITHMATLYEKYFSKNKIPPPKTLAAALKAIGYDESYTSKVPDIIENRRKSMDIRWKTLDDMFNKPSASNSKKKAKKEPEVEVEVEVEPEEDDEDEEEDDSAPAEEAIGNEEVEDDEEVVEEEYFSDGE